MELFFRYFYEAFYTFGSITPFDSDLTQKLVQVLATNCNNASDSGKLYIEENMDSDIQRTNLKENLFKSIKYIYLPRYLLKAIEISVLKWPKQFAWPLSHNE